VQHFDNILKVYAKQGLRSASEWRSLGRDIRASSNPRATIEGRGPVLDLFSRDQTVPGPSRATEKSNGGDGLVAAAPVAS